MEHCIKIHKIPKDFRFDKKPMNKNSAKCDVMKVDNEKKFTFCNNKKKSFNKYTGKRFTHDIKSESSVNIDTAMSNLKESLPK